MEYVLLIFFFNDTATTEIYTLSLHDALPIFGTGQIAATLGPHRAAVEDEVRVATQHRNQQGVDALQQIDVRPGRDRKSTRLNSSHANISYAVFCLKKKKTIERLYIILRTSRL